MKIKAIIKVLLALAMVSASSTTVFAQGKSKSLVVYFSRADENYSVGNISEGNTAILAKMIAQKTGADIFEIVPEKPYPKAYKACTEVAKDEQAKSARPSYKGEVDTSGYDTIYIGYPIWWGDLPMVVYTFLEKHDLSGKTLVPFCTHEGSGLSGTDASIKRLYKNVTLKKALVMRGNVAQNNRKDAETQIATWLK